jgi:hypothetical protein
MEDMKNGTESFAFASNSPKGAVLVPIREGDLSVFSTTSNIS